LSKIYIFFGVVFGLLFTSMAALSHHAFSAEFDANKTIKLTGVVTKLEWQNPHTWFYIDVKDASGKVTNWGFEMGSPNLLIRAGWSRSSMKAGDVVTVEGFQAKDGTSNANARVVTLNSSGQRLFAGSSQGDAAR